MTKNNRRTYKQQVYAILTDHKLYTDLANLVWECILVECDECGKVIPFRPDQRTTFAWNMNSEMAVIIHKQCLDFRFEGVVRGPLRLDVPPISALSKEARRATRILVAALRRRSVWGARAARRSEDICLDLVTRYIDN